MALNTAKKHAPVPAVRKAAPPPKVQDGYEELAGAGFEGAEADAYALPRLVMLQKMSRQVEKKSADYIKGAEAGLLLNPSSGQLFKELYAVVVRYRRTYTEWVDREAGGGFVAEHAVVDPKWERQQRGPFKVPGTDNIVNDTRNFFILYGETEEDLDDNPQEVILSLTASQLRVAKNLMTVLSNQRGKRKDGTSFTLPMYASKFLLMPKYNENADGNWYGYDFQLLPDKVPADSALFARAKDYNERIASNVVTMQQPVDVGESAPDSTM